MMQNEAGAEVAAMMIRLRTPLARIELAASQLLRALSTPGARALSSRITDAVAEMDEQIASGLEALVGNTPTCSPPEDCRVVIESLHRRIVPVLQARGIEWMAPNRLDPQQPVMGNRETTRGAALSLLQTGIELAEPGDRIALSLESGADSDRYGVALRVSPGSRTAGTPNIPECAEIFAGPRQFVRTNGGAFEIVDEPDYVGAVVWIDREPVTCVE